MICSRCKKDKPEECFHKKKKVCINCERILGRQYYRRKKAREIARLKKYEYRRTEEGRQKYYAHRAVARAIRDGRLERPLRCEVCGRDSLKIEAHHESYAKKDWLKVTWVCKRCHNKLDKERQGK